MTRVQPLFANRTTAAKMLDMTPAEFTRFVEGGALPPPCFTKEGIERWDVEDLVAIMRGDAAKPQAHEIDL